MHNCAFCGNPLRPSTEWKASNGRFYCSEYCADAGDTIEPFAAPEVRLLARPVASRREEGRRVGFRGRRVA